MAAAASIAAGTSFGITLAPSARWGASNSARSTGSTSPLFFRRSFDGVTLRLPSRKPAGSSRPLGVVRAAQQDPSTKEATEKAQKLYSDLKARWEKVEDKPTVLVYTGGALVALWFSSAIIGAFNSVPLLPKLLELVGLGYTGWFIYRYLLFTPNRQELLQKIDDITNQITGESNELADDIQAAGRQVKTDAKNLSRGIEKNAQPVVKQADSVAKDAKAELESVRKY